MLDSKTKRPEQDIHCQGADRVGGTGWRASIIAAAVLGAWPALVGASCPSQWTALENQLPPEAANSGHSSSCTNSGSTYVCTYPNGGREVTVVDADGLSSTTTSTNVPYYEELSSGNYSGRLISTENGTTKSTAVLDANGDVTRVHVVATLTESYYNNVTIEASYAVDFDGSGNLISGSATVNGVSGDFTCLMNLLDGGGSNPPPTSDTTPNAFSFSTVTNAPLSSTVTSGAITVSGINAAAPISIYGGQYSIGGGAWTSSSGTITNGQTVQVRLTSSSSYNTTTTATLSIGGVSGTFTVSTPTITRVTSTSQVISNPDAAVTLTSSGAVQIGASTTSYTLSPAAPADAAIILPTSNVNLSLAGNAIAHQAQSANTTLLIKNITVNGSATKALEVANGSVRLTAAGTGQVLTAIRPSTGSSQGYLQSAAANSSVTVSRDSNGAVVGEVSAGSTRYLRSGNGFSSSSDTTVYAGESIKTDRNGVILRQWLGSGSRNQGKVGDALNGTFGSKTGLTVTAQVPKLNGTTTRTGTSKTVDALLAEALASRFGVTLTSFSQDPNNGVLTLNYANGSLRFLPLDTLDVDFANNFAAGGNVIQNANGTLKVLVNGVYVTVAPGLYYPYLVNAVQAIDSRATVEVVGDQSSNVIYRVRNLGGLEYAVRPGFQTSGQSTVQAIPGFETVNGFVAFRDVSGALQTLFPALANANAITTNFSAMDPNFSLTDNNDGTVSARYQGTTYTLRPSYNVTAAPSSHANDLFWIDGANITFKYPDNSAQGAGL